MTSFFVTADLSKANAFSMLSFNHSLMEAPAKKRRLGEVKQLSKAELETALDDAILSKGTAELALIYLIDRYEFDLDALKARLVGMQFESSSLHGIF